jgi:uncharacterized protein YxjI
MIIIIIIHDKCSDESHSQQNFMIISITITFLIESSNQIHSFIRINDRLTFLKDRLNIELDNLSTIILTKTSHRRSIKLLR